MLAGLDRLWVPCPQALGCALPGPRQHSRNGEGRKLGGQGYESPSPGDFIPYSAFFKA